MYYILALITGVVLSVMVAFNGGLSDQYGVYSATVFIHASGLAVIGVIALINKERPFSNMQPWYLYIGGAIGVLTIVSNNLAFGRISVSAILALGLLGQSITGLIIDQRGLFGMPRHPFTKGKLVGLALLIAGIAAMIYSFETLAVVMSFIAGISIVLARTVNAKLAVLTSVRISAFYNYVIGLAVAFLVFLLLGRGEAPELVLSPYWFIYLGGALGLCIVLISNVIVVKISAFYLTLLLFVGQIFSGVMIDVFITGEISVRNFMGGLFVAVGLCINLLLDKKKF